MAGPTPFEPASLVLLQGAFSHNGLSADFDGTRDGVFHKVLDEDRVKGPIAVTHTANDRAVGLAYAIASRLAGDNAAAVGDATDPFGGIGRNGALHVVPAKVVAAVLPAAGTALALAPGKVTNLLADAWIHDHSDVRNAAAVWALRSAMLAGAERPDSEVRGKLLACTSRVRRQKRLMAARMSSADLVQRKGLGSALWVSM